MRTSVYDDRLTRRIACLRQVPLFAELGDADLVALVDEFRLREYDRDEIIFHQGDTSRELYIILKGKVRVFKTSPAGDETTIEILFTYDIFGEFALIDDQPRAATAKAIVPSELLVMTQDRFLQHMRALPDLALAMTRLVIGKLRWTGTQAETIAQYDCGGRLLHTLLLYNERFGEEQEPGVRYMLDLGLSQADLASLVGAQRSWVNRLLGDWKKRGLIEYEDGRIFILDLPRVEAERDSRIEAWRDTW
jgi:CRP/FNR family cyclic AMP-dependent transcriptional regulator